MSNIASDSWVARAEAKLTQAGHKRGGARRAVLELLADQSCALTAVEIEDALRSRRGAVSEDALGSRRGAVSEDALRSQRRAVSRASVYRILEELERVQLVQRVETGQAMVRYERVCGDSEEHHHHLVCDSCGVVMPFSDPALERAIARVSARVPLAVVSEHEIVLHGSCRQCAA